MFFSFLECNANTYVLKHKDMVNLFDRFPSLANLNEVEDVNPIRRAYSDNHINLNVDSDGTGEKQVSTLTVSTNRSNVGEKIIVSWKLAHAPSSKDWLGLFYADGKNFDNFSYN